MSEPIAQYDVVFSEYFGPGIGKKDNGKYCLYSDYLSALKRAEAAEAKLAELDKQEPYGFTHNYLSPPDNDHESIGVFKRENRHYGRPLFTRPVPAIDLADLVPPEADGSKAPFTANGWNACRDAILRNIEGAR